jgi:hypothetical protein
MLDGGLSEEVVVVLGIERERRVMHGGGGVFLNKWGQSKSKKERGVKRNLNTVKNLLEG